MDSVISGIEIRGVAACVPEKWEDLASVSGEDAAALRRFTQQTGIRGRFVAGVRQTASDLCFCAAERLLRENGTGRNDVGVLVFVSQTTDYRVPSTAFVLQKRLALGPDCLVFDVNLGCSGYVNGLSIVSSLMHSSGARFGLLLTGDTPARGFGRKEKVRPGSGSALLFGDAGAATLLERTGDGALRFSSRSDGTRYKAIAAPYGFWRHPAMPEETGNRSQMDDLEVFRFATGEVPEQILAYMAETGTSPADYDVLALHQANGMILRRIARKTGFPEEKVPVSLGRFANTSSASIPLTLVSGYGDLDEERRLRILCCGFGVGLSLATAAFEIDVRRVLPLIETEEAYDDGYPDAVPSPEDPPGCSDSEMPEKGGFA